jgi:hypothetical protein
LEIAISPQPMQTLQNRDYTRFHGGNTGSNPVGDANKANHLAKIERNYEGLKGWIRKDAGLTHRLSPNEFP